MSEEPKVIPVRSIEDLFDPTSEYFHGAPILTLPPQAQNTFTQAIKPSAVGDPQSGENITNTGLNLPVITVADTDSLQAAFEKLRQLGGGLINLLAGTYVIKSALSIYSSIELRGVSATATILDFSSTSGNLSAVGTNVYTTGTITVASGVNITGSGTVWTSAMTGRALFLGTRWYLISAVTDATHLVLAEAYGDNVTLPSTYRIASVVQNVVLSKLTLKSSTGTGLVLTDCRQIEIKDVRSIQNNKGAVFTNCSEVNGNRILVVGSTSNGIEMTNMGLSDFGSINSIGNTGHGFLLTNVKTISMEPASATANGGDGFNITTGVDIVLLPEASGNTGQGIELVATNDSVVIRDGPIKNNGSDGIKMTATSDNCRVYTCSIASNGGYGLNIAAATCDTNIILANLFTGNSSGASTDSGTSTKIRSNVGLVDN